MNMAPKPFVLHVKLAGRTVVTRYFDSIAEAEAYFGQLVRSGQADSAEIHPAESDIPVRVLQLRR
jgi:hypothetical protein